MECRNSVCAAVRLVDLDPQWAELGGVKIGFSFFCPHCLTTVLFVAIVPSTYTNQCRILSRMYPDNEGDIITARENFAWQFNGYSFFSMTINPSIDASRAGHWHGWIKDGEITNA
jgi:Family of unknown function (DUF6527)